MSLGGPAGDVPERAARPGRRSKAMPLPQDHIDDHTPMGANLVHGGATFRTWAPAARAVHLKLNAQPGWKPDNANLLVRRADGSWAGFARGAKEGDAYRFHV